MYDKFGEQISISVLDSGEGEMKITAPEAVKERYRTHLRRLLEAAET